MLIVCFLCVYDYNLAQVTILIVCKVLLTLGLRTNNTHARLSMVSKNELNISNGESVKIVKHPRW